ncbi:hypothetical protein C5167_001709 [Papaver somniferum]|uniref:RNA polymerase subunit H/Rpb5 C-terminal domain-containing protein n=1 Tax=Papaver somniferum TaxID=3469 RepID=A0A4Y7KXN5_PAPSO|nr:hypothetical protein C5167_001709 [Papaver somniferum]
MENGGEPLTIMPSCLSSMIDSGSVESHRYYLARKTTFEMLKDRGYDVPENELNLTLPEFRSIYSENPDLERLRISLPLLSNPSKRISVIFCGTEKIKKGTIRNLLGLVGEGANLTRLILVSIELFQITDLLVNITKHVLMPKHEILTPEEKKKLLAKYNLDDKQLPRMLVTDAFARYYGLEKGQVVKVTFDSDITSSHVTYRCVM